MCKDYLVVFVNEAWRSRMGMSLNVNYESA